jgi:hypothetical protein
MAKHIQLARCYFNDKDIADVLANPRFGDRALLKLAQSTGIVFNPKEPKSFLIGYLSRMPFDWRRLQEIAKQLERPEREERRGVTRLDREVTSDEMETAIEIVRAARAGNREEFKVEKVGARFIVRGKFIEIDHSRAKALQREEREYVIEIDPNSAQPSIQFTHNPKAREFVSDLIKQLKPEPHAEIESPIDLGAIKDPALRTEFFLKLRRLMTGFRQLDVQDIKVDRRVEQLAQVDADNDEAEDADEKSQEEAKAMVKSAALQGHSLLTTELYQKMQEMGYYVYRMQWSSIETDSSGRLMEFEAGFENPILANSFHYDVKRVIPNEQDKTAGLTQLEVTNRQRDRVRRLLVDAAYTALEEIRTSINENES